MSTQEAPATGQTLDYTPIYQWTHEVGNFPGKVLLVKCVPTGGISTNNFQWPKSGPVKSPNWAPEPTCNTGGLFGWAWGMNLGIGKDPDYQSDWIVFAADPAGVVGEVEGELKSKVESAEVVYYGNWHGALELTRAGREAWLEARFTAARERAMKSRETHSTDKNGASSNSGDYGASSNSGTRGASSNSGDYGASSNSGYGGASSNSGYGGASSNSGDYGASSVTGERSAAAVSGDESTLELGPASAGVVTADSFTWIVHLGAVVLHRWEDGHATLTTDGLTEGASVKVIKGIIQK